jgi:hypothetical protein
VTSGIETPTFRLVAQYLNQLRQEQKEVSELRLKGKTKHAFYVQYKFSARLSVVEIMKQK